jgi:hypothetical protein
MLAYFHYILDDFQEKKTLGVLDPGWLSFGLTDMEHAVMSLISFLGILRFALRRNQNDGSVIA